MGWAAVCGELMGSAAAAFVRKTAELNKRGKIDESNDFCPEETKQLISTTLENCRPSNLDLTWWGRQTTEFYLGKNDYLGSLLSIDGNTKLTKRAYCILALKTAAKCICSGYNEDALRAVTYSYLAFPD